MKRQEAWAILVTGLLSVATSAFGAQAPEGFFPLKSGDIRKALVGKQITYDPPGTADMGLHEEFHPKGVWGGMLSGRGPIFFSGRWSINGDQMCVTADSGTQAELWHPGLYCRQVWQNRKTGELRIEYLGDHPSSSSSLKMGLQSLVVCDLTMIK